MLKIKFKKTGKKHQAFLRLIVAEKRSKLNGKFVDDLGWVNPHEKKEGINKERVLHWLRVGAQPTESVHNLLVRHRVIKGKKIAIHKKSKKATEAEGEKKEESKAEAPADAPAEQPKENEEKPEEPAETAGEENEKEVAVEKSPPNETDRGKS